MKPELARLETPEERELAEKHQELSHLEETLAERELELVTIEAKLRAFDSEYARVIGTRYAELDEIEAQIAEHIARQYPKDTTAQRMAAEARARARATAQGRGDAQGLDSGPDDFQPSPDLQDLYRTIAKAVHPDLADCEDDRAVRERVMAEANEAYGRGDRDRLREILQQWNMSPDSVKEHGVGAELVRAIRKIHLVKNRLREITSLLEQLRESHLCRLWSQFEEATQHGSHPMGEMAAQIDREIARARERLAVTRCGGK